MPNITLKRPIALGLTLQGAHRELKPGDHILTNEEMGLWFIPGLIKSGDIVVHDDVPGQPVELSYAAHTVFYKESSKQEEVEQEEAPTVGEMKPDAPSKRRSRKKEKWEF